MSCPVSGVQDGLDSERWGEGKVISPVKMLVSPSSPVMLISCSCLLYLNEVISLLENNPDLVLSNSVQEDTGNISVSTAVLTSVENNRRQEICEYCQRFISFSQPLPFRWLLLG